MIFVIIRVLSKDQMTIFDKVFAKELPNTERYTLWPYYKWSDIRPQYSGLVFGSDRVLSKSFGDNQFGHCPRQMYINTMDNNGKLLTIRADTEQYLFAHRNQKRVESSRLCRPIV